MIQRTTSFIVMLLAINLYCIGQKKQEQEFGIDKDGLPKKIIPTISDYLYGAKRLRFYKELDGKKISYEVKLKKDRLRYSIEFDENGTLEDVEVIVKQVDIPEGAFENITQYLRSNHGKYRIKKMQQQYVNTGNAQETLKEAFQNLILPKIRYELIIATKGANGHGGYEITFDAMGKHILTRRAITANYDHVLFQ